jgi:ABC-type antimicrobial peptide transport system permease subunit
MLLGAVGIYGVIAYVVSRRTPEIGVRVALGATSGDIWSRVVARSFLPALLGTALGLGVAALGSRVLTSLLFETSPLDATAFVAGPAAFLIVAAAACVVPARRAMKIDPVRALRCE